MGLPEILAPAGDDDSLAAALSAGADAVYFGLDEGLNARARATNFSVARLPSICDRIHRAGAKAYVTLNTLVFENELPIVEAVLRACALSGVDAIIVQDPAVALIARVLAPTLEVHASTQMTISSPDGAEFARQLGATRVVVPRELSVDEIRQFKNGTSIELEVFIHGALCMSWSGQCLTSEAWGGRSANRGQCAQSCRLPYQLVVDGEVRPLGEVAYLLSPLDLAGARAVEQLSDIGVSSLKIEGRLKGPAYVWSTVQGYRHWRDAVAEQRMNDGEAIRALQRDLGKMAVAYSRGFSDGFLAGSDHQDLVEGRFPKHRGALLGVVAEITSGSVRVRRSERQPTGGVGLNDGGAPVGATKVALPVIGGASASDSRGLRVEVPEPIPGCGVGFDTGRPQQEEPGGPIFGVEPAPGGWWLRFGRPGPDLSAVKVGDLAWLSSDPRLTEEAKDAVVEGHKGVSGRIGVALEVKGSAGSPLWVSLKTTGARVCSVSMPSADVLTESTGAGLTAALIAAKLGSFGGTPFRLESLDASGLGAGLHVPVSTLKSLRRELVAQLEAAVLARARHPVKQVDATAHVVAEAKALAPRRLVDATAEMASVIPLVRKAEQLEAVIALGFREVELDWMELVGLERAVNRAKAAGLRVIIATTRIQKPGEDGVDARLERLNPDGILARHWGALMHFSRRADSPLRVHGDFSLNVTNSVTAHRLLSLGADTLTAAHDLDEAQLFAMLSNVSAERFTVTVHHHIATFHTEHCVYAHTLSHGRDFRTCGRPCESHRVALSDPKGLEHPVVVDVGCRNTVFNAQAQSAASALPKLKAAGIKRFRVEFVWENEAVTRSVLEVWRELVDGRISPAQLNQRIRAHEQFGVTAGTMRTLEARNTP